jgi:hypothetical protein
VRAGPEPFTPEAPPVRHPGPVSALSPALRRRAKARKALRIAMFCVILVLCVILALLVLARFAGGWGIPYFSTTTDRGSRCVNTFTGFECPSLTLADVEYFGDVDLPDDTRVVRSRYVHPSPLDEPDLTSLCILANDQETTQEGTPDSRVYVVGTALRADKTRVINLSVRSR